MNFTSNPGNWRGGHRILVVLGLLVTFGAVALPQGQGNVTAAHTPDDRGVFVVDGITEPLSRWQEALRLVQSQSPANTSEAVLRTQLLQSMTEGFAALHEAQQKGISISDQEIAAFTEQEKQLVAGQPDLTAQVEHLAQVLGLTVDQFWARQQSNYKTDLLIGKLRAQYYDDLGLLSDDQKAAKWMEHLKQLAAAATVTILDPANVQ